jgi:hypothetical protein
MKLHQGTEKLAAMLTLQPSALSLSLTQILTLSDAESSVARSRQVFMTTQTQITRQSRRERGALYERAPPLPVGGCLAAALHLISLCKSLHSLRRTTVQFDVTLDEQSVP